MSEGIGEEEVTDMLRRGMAAATYDEHHQVGRDLRKLAHAWRAERAEVERLREERDGLARVAMQRGEQAAKWSAKLDEVGETCQEWAADGQAGWMQWPVPEESEAYARRIVDDATRVGLNATLKRRLAGEWREVPDA